jgi:hypothetical protein
MIAFAVADPTPFKALSLVFDAVLMLTGVLAVAEPPRAELLDGIAAAASATGTVASEAGSAGAPSGGVIATASGLPDRTRRYAIAVPLAIAVTKNSPVGCQIWSQSVIVARPAQIARLKSTDKAVME